MYQYKKSIFSLLSQTKAVRKEAPGWLSSPDKLITFEVVVLSWKDLQKIPRLTVLWQYLQSYQMETARWWLTVPSSSGDIDPDKPRLWERKMKKQNYRWQWKCWKCCVQKLTWISSTFLIRRSSVCHSCNLQKNQPESFLLTAKL